MKLTKSQLRKIIKEETNKVVNEIDASHTLAVTGSIYLGYKALTFLLSVFRGIRDGVKSGIEQYEFDKKVAENLIRDPEIRKILKKFEEDTPENRDIIFSLVNGDLEKGSQQVEDSGLLSDEELKIFNDKVKFSRGMQSLGKMAIHHKYGMKENVHHKHDDEHKKEKQVDSSIVDSMENIFINAMDGSPLRDTSIKNLKKIDSSYYEVKSGRIYPTKRGIKFLKDHGVETEGY